MLIFWVMASGILSALSFMSLIHWPYWWIRMFNFPQFQLTIVGSGDFPIYGECVLTAPPRDSKKGNIQALSSEARKEVTQRIERADPNSTKLEIVLNSF